MILLPYTEHRAVLSNPVAIHHMWRQALLMWRQALFLQFHYYLDILIKTTFEGENVKNAVKQYQYSDITYL